MNRGIATFTLDYGHCPPWLFDRMVRLAREMTQVLIAEYGPDEFVKRIADPVWFQSLGTVLAFDWNASGLTTILTAALKEAIRGQEKDLGIFICGGKGATSRKTPDQISEWGETLNLPEVTSKSLVRNSKMSAKVDSSLVQDGYQLYHHAFFFSVNKATDGVKKVGSWAVVQQGMNIESKTARRYHWYDTIESQNGPIRQVPFQDKQGKNLKSQNRRINFVNEPHKGIASQKKEDVVLNLVSKDSSKTRDVSTELIKAGHRQIRKDLELLQKHNTAVSKMVSFKSNDEKYTFLNLSREDFRHHQVEIEDFSSSKYLERILQRISDEKPKTYEEFVGSKGVGPKTVRSLALVSEIIYGAPPSYQDPARYSFAHGGKDSIPYPVDRPTYDETICILKEAVRKTKLPSLEKDKIIRRI